LSPSHRRPPTENAILSLHDALPISPVELTHECLSRIERLNPKLNAFITVTADSALAEARQAEAEIQHDGWRGPLHGIPIALKDLDRKSTRLNSSHQIISYAVFCLKK